MTKFHQDSYGQSHEGQGFRRSNSIAGITNLTRRRIRRQQRQQRRSNPYPAVLSSARRNHGRVTRDPCLPLSECQDVVSETSRGRENLHGGRYHISDFCQDGRLNLSWTVTDVSTPQGRKLIIKRCRNEHPRGIVPLVKRNVRTGKRRKRFVSMCTNKSDKISSSDESVQEYVLEGSCVQNSSKSIKDENCFNQNLLLSENDSTGGDITAMGSDDKVSDCRRLRRENTLILGHDVTKDGVRDNHKQKAPNPVTKPNTNPASKPVTNDSFVDLLVLDTGGHRNNDMLATGSESFSYNRLLAPVEHFRCLLCDTNLEALRFGQVGESLDIMDLSRFHIEDGLSDVTLFCPECGFSQIGYC